MVKGRLLKIGFRPFPADEIAEALKNVKAIAVMDNADAILHGRSCRDEVKSALMESGWNKGFELIYGLAAGMEG
jgi:pyruvate ferredoxin oxidoreductase alpha subunit